MASLKSSSSKGSSQISSDLYSKTSSGIGGNFARQFKESLFELFLNLNGVKRFSMDRWMLLFLEVTFLMGFLIDSIKDILLWDESVSTYAEYVFLLVDPMVVATSFVSYLVIFLIAAGYLFCGSALIMYLSYTKTSNELLCTVGMWFCRLTRTLFFYPLMYVFLSSMRCDMFGGSFTMEKYPEYSCVEFPFLLFWVVGILMMLITLGIGTIDTVFLMDKFKGIDLWTAAPDGRFQWLMFCIQSFSLVLIQYMRFQGMNALVISSIGVSILFLVMSVFVLIRFVPFFHYQFVCIYGTAMMLVLVTKLTLLATIASSSWWMLFFFCLAPISVVFIWVTLCVRYALLLRFFGRNKVRSNVLLCYFSVDIIIGIYVKEYFSRFCNLSCLRSRSRKISPYTKGKGKGSVDMMSIVTSLLNDEDFEKTKNLCQLLACLTFDKNPQLSKIILNHTSTIMREDFMDVELSLQFYKLQTTHVQHTGEADKKKKLKLISELGRASKREDELSKLMKMLLQELASEDRKVSFANFPNLITSIQINLEFCEGVYEKLVRITPCTKTYNAYASYLIRFHNDKRTAQLYLKEAKQLAYTQGRRSDYSAPSQADTAALPAIGMGIDREGPAVEIGKENDYTSSSSETAGEVEKESTAEVEDEQTNDSCGDQSSEENEMGAIEEEKNIALDDYRTSSSSSEDASQPDVCDKPEEEFVELGFDEKKNTIQVQWLEECVQEQEANILPGSGEVLDPMSHVSYNEEHSSTGKGKDAIEQIREDFERQSDTGTALKTDDDQVSYTRKDSVITKHTTSSGGSSDVRSHLAKKVVSGTYCSTWLIRGFCSLLFLTGVGVIIALFSMSFVLHNDFSGSAELVVLASDLQKSVTEGAHFLRKLQVSYYSPEETPLGYERDPVVFDKLVLSHCEKINSRAKNLYNGMSEGQAAPWNDVKVELVDHVLELGEDGRDHVYQSETYSLLDGTLLYGEKCMEFWRIHEEVMGRYGTVNYTVGNRCQDDENFLFVTLNEPGVFYGLEKLKEHLLEYEEGDSFNLELVYIIIPCALSLLFPVLFLVVCAYSCQQRRTFKGFFLIPKEQLHEMEDKISRKDGSSVGGGSSNSEARVDTTKCSLIRRFFLLSCMMIIVMILASLVFTLLGVLTCQRFTTRNRQYEKSLELSILVRRVHLWTVELIYRDDTLFTDEEIVEGLANDLELLAEVYEAIRTGSTTHNVEGNDKEEGIRGSYYDDNCDLSQTFSDQYEFLKCLSLNQKIELMIESAEDLIRSNFTDHAIRSDEKYEMIIMIDNYNNGSIFDEGAAEKQLKELEEYTATRVDSYLSYLQSMSLLLLIIFLPLYTVTFCVLFYSYPRRLNRNISMVRRVMMLMNKKQLMSKNIYEYVSGKSSFGKSFSREQKNQIDLVCDTFQHQSFGIIIFNKKFTIVRYNTTAEELFNVKAVGARKIGELFEPKSFTKINRFVSGKKKVFNGELVAKYDDQEYTVLCDISRGEGLFSGIFENLESSKKKDLLREAERRDNKTEQLIQNILPRELAKSFKIDELLGGNCMITEHKKATAYFCDICDFTGMSQNMETQEIIELLHDFFSRIDDVCDQFKLEKIKTIGDCYFAISGIPTYKPLHAKMAMDFAIEVLRMVNEMNKTRSVSRRIYIRTGLSSGKLIAGIIGKRKFCYDTWGPMINEAARMEHHGYPGKIQVSRATYESIFNLYEFMEREIHLQGIGVNVKAYVHTPNFMNPDELARKGEDLKSRDVVKAVQSEQGELMTPKHSNMKTSPSTRDLAFVETKKDSTSSSSRNSNNGSDEEEIGDEDERAEETDVKKAEEEEEEEENSLRELDALVQQQEKQQEVIVIEEDIVDGNKSLGNISNSDIANIDPTTMDLEIEESLEEAGPTTMDLETEESAESLEEVLEEVE